MTILKLYDPARHPPDWNDQLRDGKCAVFLCDARSGVEVNPEGQPLAKGDGARCYVFKSREEAIAFCRGIVERFEDVQGQVFDHRGRSADAVFTHLHPKYAARFPTEESIRRRLLLSWLLMLPAPFLFWWDYRHNLLLILPTFIGINLIVVAMRIRMWASGEREAMRRSEESDR